LTVQNTSDVLIEREVKVFWMASKGPDRQEVCAAFQNVPTSVPSRRHVLKHVFRKLTFWSVGLLPLFIRL